MLKNKRNVETFGIAGSSSGVGVTYFSILLANYLYGVENRKTVVLEWNKNGDFERIEKICCKNTVLKQHVKTFKVLEVSYVKEAGKAELLEYVNHGYDAVVIDFGSDFKGNKEEFLRCDRKILIGSFCEWKSATFIDLISGKRKEEGKWFFLTRSGNFEMGERVRKILHTPVGQIPESADAFAITEVSLAFFKGFLK